MMNEITKVERVEDEIISKNIALHKISTNEIAAASIKHNDRFAIFFNPKKLETNANRYCALEHELAHIETGSLYGFDTSIRARQRREYKADKHMVQKIVPIDKLKKALAYGLERWEIAEELCVTEEVVITAFKIYKNMEMI